MKELLKKITLPKVVSTFFSILFIIAVVNTIFFNKTTTIDFSPTIMLVGVIVVYIVMFLVRKIGLRFCNVWDKLIQGVIKNKKLLALFVFLVQIFIISMAYRNCGFDCGYVVIHARKLLIGETTDGIFDLSYFSNYTNNLTLLYLFKYMYQFIGLFFEITEENIFLITAIFNVIMIDVAMIALIKICKKLFSKNVTALVILFSVPLIMFNPYMIVAYSDTISMCMPVLIFYLYLKIKENKKTQYLYAFLEGLLLFWGYYIKPTVLIIGVAIIVTEIFFSKFSDIRNIFSKKFIFKHMARLVAFSLSIVISFGALSSFKKNELEKLIPDWIFELNSVPPTHFLMMGLNQQEQPGKGKNTTVYGSYYVPDVFGTLGIKGKENKKHYNLSVVKKRLEDYKVSGYIDFLYKKFTWIISDGTFFYGQEGGFYNFDFINKSRGARKVQKYFDINSNFYQNYEANAFQIIWVVLLVGIVFSLGKYDKNIITMKITILGIIMFILLFEGRSRYLYSYIPFFIMIGVTGISELVTFKRKKKLLDYKDKVTSNNC